MATELKGERGRLLVLGSAEERPRCAEALRSAGFQVEESEPGLAAEALRRGPAELVVLCGAAPEPVRALRAQGALGAAGLLALGAAQAVGPLRAAGADDVALAWEPGEIPARVDLLLRVRRASSHISRGRLQLEILENLGRIGLSSMPLDDRLHAAVKRIAEAFDADRCSVVLAEGAPQGRLVVAAAPEHPGGYHRAINLSRYPEIRRALETREAVQVDDALADPLMGEVRHLLEPLDVRSILVQPLLCQGEQLGALFLRRAGRAFAYGPEERGFAAVAASALTGMIHTARLHASLRRKREELESAYVDRYRELVEANHRLKELNRFKDETLAVCSHDLRGPLNVLLGHARLLVDAELEAEEAASTQAILRQGKRLLDLVETLLDRGRGEASRLTLEPVRVDLGEICRELASEHGILGAERGVSIEVEAPPKLELLADRVKLRQIVQNLLGNALTWAREGGTVRVRASRVERPDGEVARVAIADDGPGIPAQELPAVFERYRHGLGGVGLGLAICREFVELHGGEIWAESGAGRGSTVTFTLPLADVHLPGQGLNPSSGERKRILLVEDEPEIAAITAEILRSAYRVDLARDGAEAVAKARALAPDLVLMDVFLPRVDGLDAAATLKAAPDTRDIPVILVSAHQGVAEKVRALNLGAVDYLAKPYQARDLLARVESALKAREGERAAAERPSGLDAATGLLERGAWLRRLAQELSRARRGGRPLAVVGVEPAAALEPAAVAAAAAALRGALRASDLLAHLGDGRFCACLPEATECAAREVCARLKDLLAGAAGVAEIRVGVVEAGPAATPEELLLQASRRAQAPA